MASTHLRLTAVTCQSITTATSGKSQLNKIHIFKLKRNSHSAQTYIHYSTHFAMQHFLPSQESSLAIGLLKGMVLFPKEPRDNSAFSQESSRWDSRVHDSSRAFQILLQINVNSKRSYTFYIFITLYSIEIPGASGIAEIMWMGQPYHFELHAEGGSSSSLCELCRPLAALIWAFLRFLTRSFPVLCHTQLV